MHQKAMKQRAAAQGQPVCSVPSLPVVQKQRHVRSSTWAAAPLRIRTQHSSSAALPKSTALRVFDEPIEPRMPSSPDGQLINAGA